MRLRGVLPVGAAVTDMRPQLYERGTRLFLPCSAYCRAERIHVIAVTADRLHEPAVCLVPLRDILIERQRRVAVNAYMIVVVHDDEVVELEMSRQGGGLRRDPFHHATVSGYHEDPVVQQPEVLTIVPVRKILCRDRHPDRVGNPLTERSGRDLDTGCVTVLGMARGAAPPLPEVLQLVQGQIISRQVKERIQEHVGRRGHSHGHAGMARFRLLDRINRKTSDGVDAHRVKL